MSQLTLDIVTPQRTVLSTKVDWVTLPGTNGELGVLPEHIPLVSTLRSGVLVYQSEGQKQAVAVHWGYAQVDQDHISILAELAETAEEIDLARAEAAQQKATELLKGDVDPEADAEQDRLKKYEGKLHRSLIRQMVANY